MQINIFMLIVAHLFDKSMANLCCKCDKTNYFFKQQQQIVLINLGATAYCMILLVLLNEEHPNKLSKTVLFNLTFHGKSSNNENTLLFP